MRCEHCGADAVDASGICRDCGWRAGTSIVDDYGSSPSLAATRAADVPPPARPNPNIRRSAPGAPFLPQRAASPTSAQTYDRQGGTISGSAGTSRYCGTCGARIDPAQQFCGQCGAAVTGTGVSGPEYGTELRRAPLASAPFGSSAGAWSTGEYDAPTEAFSDALPSLAGSYSAAGQRTYTSPAGQGMSREVRIVFGILCILGGLVSGAGAIILAVAGGH
jgi:hypothetical protein